MWGTTKDREKYVGGRRVGGVFTAEVALALCSRSQVAQNNLKRIAELRRSGLIGPEVHAKAEQLAMLRWLATTGVVAPGPADGPFEAGLSSAAIGLFGSSEADGTAPMALTKLLFAACTGAAIAVLCCRAQIQLKIG